MTESKPTEFYHDPVLLKECLEYLNLRKEGVFVDCTLGGGGHSSAIARELSESGTLHCFDRDPEAIAFATKRLEGAKPNIVFHPVAFAALGEEVETASCDGILYDLGISSRQVDSNERGFTFVGDVPLDLRMDTRQDMSAQEWLREVSEEDLASALRYNADLERAMKLAMRLKACVSDGHKILPSDVKEIVLSVFPDKKRDANGILARVFQAIRMEVNGELEQIKTSMRSAVECLKAGGRLVIMSYHSVEDRCVKDVCAEFERACICPPELPICKCGGKNQKLKKVLRKPMVPSDEEIKRNSRARSAKLRVYERV